MRYYIVDDKIGIVKAIENIIESRNLGDVIGFNTAPEKAVEEILVKKPDIVMADLLMPTMDGIELVRKIKKLSPEIYFVMISKVTDKEMVAQAYDAGIEFFIHKPINIKEIESVIGNVAEKYKMNTMMENIRGIFSANIPENGEEARTVNHDDQIQEIKALLGMLGMSGEKGTTDILAICQYLINNNCDYSKIVLEEVAESKGDSSKNMEQRIRRAMKKGLTNVASIGLSDYGNDIFQVYANYVFDFRSINEEMECIKGNNQNGGRVAIPKFIYGLMMYKNSKNV
ncbi:DNA-binding domain-containing protein [Eubacteriales bacterium KG127]